MSKYPIPSNEKERLAKLYQYEILDTEAEEVFDNLTKLVAQILDVPIVLVSLVDKDRQWFKSKYGLDTDETPRNISFCQYAIMDKNILEVENATQDDRFKNSPLVTDSPNIRFYAGAPLIDDEGLNIGTLCAVDTEPKRLTKLGRHTLDAISKTIMRLIINRQMNRALLIHKRIFDISAGMMCIASTDGFFKFINPAFSQILGWQEEELLDKPFFDFIHPDDIQATADEVAKQAEGETTINFTNRYKTSDGNWKWLQWCAIPDTETGGLYAVASDVTELIETQIGLQKAKEEGERLAQVKNNFLSNMSHEIRTPLNAIMGFNDLLSKSQLNGDQKKYVEMASNASKTLSVLINDILDISKLESGKLALENRPFSIESIIKQIVQLQSPSAKEKEIKLIYSIDNEIPDFVVGDETRLIQILTNLLSNAIKFTDEGYVELKCVEHERGPSESTISFVIKDTGIGIEEGKLELIFERFMQASKSTSRVYGGTGLGLSIVKMLVELHGGKLNVDSTINKGSEFIFEITYPIGSASGIQANSKNRETPTSGPLDGIKILLVEDNLHNQFLAKTFLQRHNVIVELADNGAIAVDMMRAENYDAVLMDLQMPIMDGFTATQKIRKDLDLDLPIIACSAHSLAGEREKCIATGMDEYISKPYTEEQLISTLVEFVGHNNNKSKGKEILGDKNVKDDFKSILKALEKDEGHDFVETIVNIFKNEIPKDIDELEDYINNDEIEKISKKVHYIAGSLASCKFYKGYRLAKNVEKQTRENNLELSKSQSTLLIKYLKNALSELS